MTAAADVPLVRLVESAARDGYAPEAHTRRNAPDETLSAEAALLGVLLVAPGEGRNAEGVRIEHFADERHRVIFQAIRDEQEESGATDLVGVGERLRSNTGDDGLVRYAAKLAEEAPTARNLGRYAELVREKAERRAVAALGAEIVALSEHVDLAELRDQALAKLAAVSAGPQHSPVALDLAVLGETKPEKPPHVIQDWLPAGEVTLLAGHGGSGKSAIALHLAVCIALGVPWFGLPTERRPVLYLSAEDPARVLHWRLSRIAAHLGVGLGELAGHIAVVDLSDRECELMIEPRYGEEPMATTMYETVRKLATPDTVIVIDGASDFYGASEIVRRHVRRFIRVLRRLIGPLGAVILLAHVDKAAARDGSASDRYSGSTAWHNSVRSRWSLAPEAEGEDLVLSLAKANHARAGAQVRLRWNPDAHLYLATSSPTEGGVVGAIRDRAEREGILAAMRACAAAGIAVPAAAQGPRTAFHVLRAQPAFPESLKAENSTCRRRFWTRIEELRVLRAIEERVIRAHHRHAVATLLPSSGASR